jgi:hypothetical protein
MLSALKFCAGSVAKKEIVAALTHFAIEGGRVRGFNGTLALSSPIDFNISCKPKAETLIKAIANCEDTIQLALTPAGRLSIKSGVFKAFVDCFNNEETPHVEPEGDRVDFDGEAFFQGIKAVSPFIGADASRLWAQGILFKDKSLFATNNIILVQYWIGVAFPHVVNIPKPAIKEMLRINEPPIYCQIAENSITFHYEGERWLRTQLYNIEWPNLSKILDAPSKQSAFDNDVFKALDVIKPFIDKMGSVYFKEGNVSTHEQADDGASYAVPSMVNEGRFNHTMLSLLEGSVETIDWSTWPAACCFTGCKNRLRGAIIGMHK